MIKFRFLALFSFLSLTAFGQNWPLADYEMIDAGSTLVNGLSGGVNAPQFFKMDANRDGVDDLLVFDRDGHKGMIYEAVAANGCLSYELNYELASYLPDMLNFAIPADYTGDGVEDLFSFSQVAADGIHVYRGIDAGDHLEFELVDLDQDYAFNVLAFESSGSQLSNVPVSRIDLPAIYDVDNDGDLDIFTFPSNGGSIQLYENMQADRNLDYDEIVFVLADGCWGKFYESDNSEEIFLSDNDQDCATPNLGPADSRHNGSATLIWDPNRDGLPDIMIGDFTSDNLVHLQNGGTLEKAHMTSQDFKFPAYDQSVDMSTFLAAYNLDINCDGMKDILVAPNITNGSAKNDNVLYYKNVGVNQDSFEFVSNTFFTETMFDFGIKSSPAVADVNGDGFLDIVVGVSLDENNSNPVDASLILLMNNGDEVNPGFILWDENYLNLRVFSEGSRAFAPTFGDMDTDGDLDIIVGDEEGFLIYGENVAGPGQPISIPNVQYGWMGIDTRKLATPSVADINGDGLLDLVIGVRNKENDPVTGMPCGNMNYFENIGTASVPNFNSNLNAGNNTVCLGNINIDYFNSLSVHAAPAFYDTGDSLIMLAGSNEGAFARYVVGGTDETWLTVDEKVGGVDEGSISRPAIGDLNNDGVLELIAGNQRGGISIYNSNIKTTGELISSTSNPMLTSDLNLYPNPVRAGDMLRFGSSSELLRTVLYDMQGRQIQDWSSVAESVVVPNVAPGVYFMSIFATGQVHTEKLIIL